jgi:hypothetical protein
MVIIARVVHDAITLLCPLLNLVFFEYVCSCMTVCTVFRLVLSRSLGTHFIGPVLTLRYYFRMQKHNSFVANASDRDYEHQRMTNRNLTRIVTEKRSEVNN